MFNELCHSGFISSWLLTANTLLQQLFTLAIVWLVIIRFYEFPRPTQPLKSKWELRIGLTLVFSLFAIYGAHNSIQVDSLDLCLLNNSETQLPHQPTLDLRDSWALLAGLKGGILTGLCVALFVGIESYFQGRLIAEGYALTTITLLAGIYAGMIRHFFPHWLKSVSGTLGVILIAAGLKYFTLLGITNSASYAQVVSLFTTGLNMTVVVLFMWIISDLERDRQEQLLQQAELRVLRAQIDPHFLNNALNNLTGIIHSDPVKAEEHVCELAKFFNFTRKFAGLNTISLGFELEQLKRFLAIMRLDFGDKLDVKITIPQELLKIQVLSGCLLTLVENALKHGAKGQSPPYLLQIRAETQQSNLILMVRDNGCGFASELFPELGKHAIKSSGKGGGIALYHLTLRLTKLFGEKASLTFSNANGAVVRLIQPLAA